MDIFYCRAKEKDFIAGPFDEAKMREVMLGILEGLESFQPDSEKWRQFLRRLFLLSMGEYTTEEDQLNEESKSAE